MRARPASRVIFALAVAGLAAGACAPLTTDAAIPLRDVRPNPEPAIGYRVVCETVEGPFDIFFAHRLTGCRQEIAPIERRVVVRAKG